MIPPPALVAITVPVTNDLPAFAFSAPASKFIRRELGILFLLPVLLPLCGAGLVLLVPMFVLIFAIRFLVPAVVSTPGEPASRAGSVPRFLAGGVHIFSVLFYFIFYFCSFSVC